MGNTTWGTRLDTELHLHQFQAPTNPMCSAGKSLFPGSKALILNPSSILGRPVFVGLCSREDRRPRGVCRVPAGFPIPASHHMDLLTIYLTFQTPGMVIHLGCGWRKLRPFGLVHEAKSQLTAPEVEAIPVYFFQWRAQLKAALSDRFFKIPLNHDIANLSFFLFTHYFFSTTFLC